MSSTFEPETMDKSIKRLESLVQADNECARMAHVTCMAIKIELAACRGGPDTGYYLNELAQMRELQAMYQRHAQENSRELQENKDAAAAAAES